MNAVIEQKRQEVKRLQGLINRFTKVPAYKVKRLNAESKKMIWATITEYDQQRLAIIKEIIALQGA